MEHRKTRAKQTLINPEKWGVSFSVKQCRNFGIDQKVALRFLLQNMGFRRFRLMSYWDEIEKRPGKLDFTYLDQQIDLIEKAGGVVTLCLGARQPRWPENHWPNWAWSADKSTRSQALLAFIKAAIDRYKNRSCVISWQLENEALLKSFGQRSEIDRSRLNQEFDLVRSLDTTIPVVMSTSTSWGIPLRKPIPDIVGFSYYHEFWDNESKSYKKASGHYTSLHKFRALLIKLLWQRPSVIHELQCEPWGPANIWEMPILEQDASMSAKKIVSSITKAKRTSLYPIDLWGGEWWYWRYKKFGDDTVYKAVLNQLT